MASSFNLFLIVGFVVSLLLATICLRIWESSRANIATRKIIGSTKEEKARSELIKSLLPKVNFNREETKKNLVAAGIYNDFIADIYYLIKIVPFLLVLAWIGYGYFLVNKGLITSLLYLLVALFVFIIGPDAYLSSRAKANVKHISSRLPFLLDLMNVCVHTGMTLESSLEYLSKELETVDKHLAYVIRVTVERSRLVGLEKALDEFRLMVPSSEAQSFVMTLVQSLQFGSSVGPVLATLAADIRELNIMVLEEKIGKMGAKISIPLITFIMLPIVVLIAAPGIMRML